MSGITQQIRFILERDLQPVRLELKDTSSSHIGHAGYREGGESHFELMIVSPLFEGKTRLQRQRMVNKAIKDMFEAGLHALSIRALSPSENE